MDIDVTPLNLLQLWALAASGGSCFDALSRPAMSKADRERLSSLGLIEAFRERPTPRERKKIRALAPKKPQASGQPQGSGQPQSQARAKGRKASEQPLLKLRLTGEGVRFLADSWGLPISQRAKIPPRLVEFLLNGLFTPQGAPLLAALLAALLGRLGKDAPPAASSFDEAPPSGEAPSPDKAPEASSKTPSLDPDEMLRRLRSVSQDNLMATGAIRLHVVRRLFSGFGRGQVDDCLRALQKRREIVIYPFDEPAMITEADREAALQTAGGPRHYIYLK
jgi:hypothetical protein